MIAALNTSRPNLEVSSSNLQHRRPHQWAFLSGAVPSGLRRITKEYGTPEELVENVKTDFVAKYNLRQHYEYIVKGALLAILGHERVPKVGDRLSAKDLASWQKLLGDDGRPGGRGELAFRLRADEVSAINDERLSNWRVYKQRKSLYFSVLMVSIAAAIQGWDQVALSAAQKEIMDQFNLSGRIGILGLINATPYISICFCSSLLAGPLNTLFGRRWTILIGAIFSTFAPWLSYTAKTPAQLCVYRILLGLGMGLKEVTVPIYTAEIAPTNIRGTLLMFWQLWLAFGILMGSLCNVVIAENVKSPTAKVKAWQYQVAMPFIPAALLLIGMCLRLAEESPRWYFKQSKVVQAYEGLAKLRNTKIQAARELYEMWFFQLRDDDFTILTLDELKEKKRSVVQLLRDDVLLNPKQRFFELFPSSNSRLHNATVAASVVMVAQQLSGINVVIFYSSTIFTKAAYAPIQALWITVGFALVNFLFTMFAFWFIDTLGRRKLLLYSFPAMLIFLLVAGMAFLINHDQQPRQYITIAVFIFLFCAAYSPGAGPVPFTYSAEVFPLKYREAGMSWAIFVVNFLGAIITFTTAYLTNDFPHPQVLFSVYVVTNLLAFVLIFVYVRETAGASIDNLNRVFKRGLRTVFQQEHKILYKIFWKDEEIEDFIDASSEHSGLREQESESGTKDDVGIELHEHATGYGDSANSLSGGEEQSRTNLLP